ncbi:hypothetical protein DV737_g4905, partial [Chaetothyriales sp. CBS 132003]
MCAIAFPETLVVAGRTDGLTQFDDIETDGGWGEVPSNYGSLHFEGFYVFKPTDPEIGRVISENDLNCATSKPNALYGTRFNFEDEPKLPFISAAAPFSQDDKMTVGSMTGGSSEPPTLFELESLKVKALDMPFAYTTLSLPLEWAVDFPAGFHDMFKVDIEAFSGRKWSNLTKLEIWADFHDDSNGIVLDWEYCFDDLRVRFDVG